MSFSEEEAAMFFECAELEVEIEKALRCSDPELRDEALTYLGEEIVQLIAQFADEVLQRVDNGEVELSDAAREGLLRATELAIDRPDWYRFGDRVVLPEEAE